MNHFITFANKLLNNWLCLCFLIIPSGLSAQTRINCGKTNFTVPSFNSDPKSASYEQFFVKYHLIEPINESKSDFEIRYYANQGVYIHELLIIRCDKQGVKAERFHLEEVDRQFSDQLSIGFVQVLPPNYKGDRFLFLKKDTHLKPQKVQSWKYFFTELIKYHIYNAPSEDEMRSIVMKRYPEISGVGESAAHIELKVKDKFRYIKSQLSYYEPEPTDIKVYNDLQHVFYLLTQIQ